MSSGHGDQGKGQVHHEEEHEEHEEHVNHEAWVIPYADLLTLLMAMFVALFAISTVDLVKFRELAVGFNKALGGDSKAGVLEQPGQGIIGPGGSDPKPAQLSRTDASKTDATRVARLQGELRGREVKATQQLDEVKTRVEQAAQQAGVAGNLSLRVESRGLVVTIVTDEVLFDSGSSTLTERGMQILRVVGQPLAQVPNPLLIEGHSDDRPISSQVFPSNWELSTARAGAVVRYFERDGIASSRLQAAGHADQRPLADNATDEGRARNRRVEVIVQAVGNEERNLLLEEIAHSGRSETSSPVGERDATAEKSESTPTTTTHSETTGQKSSSPTTHAVAVTQPEATGPARGH